MEAVLPDFVRVLLASNSSHRALVLDQACSDRYEEERRCDRRK